MSAKQEKAEARALRALVKALTPVPPARDGEQVILLVPEGFHDDDVIVAESVRLGCNMVVSPHRGWSSYHHAAYLAGIDVSGPVIYRHRDPPPAPLPPDPADLLVRIEELERQIRAYPKL